MDDKTWSVLGMEIMKHSSIEIEGYDEVSCADTEGMTRLEQSLRRDTRPQDPCYCESGGSYEVCCLATGESLMSASLRSLASHLAEALQPGYTTHKTARRRRRKRKLR